MSADATCPHLRPGPGIRAFVRAVVGVEYELLDQAGAPSSYRAAEGENRGLIKRRSGRTFFRAPAPGLYRLSYAGAAQGGASAYVMADPASMEVRLYTFIPTVSGRIMDWTLDLYRIRDMGFNAVHLLPITAADTSHSPYAARDQFQVDPGFVSGRDGHAELEAFINEAVRLGIRLCFDLVLNHVGTGSEMVRRHPDWITPDPAEADGLKRAGCWHLEEWIAWRDLALINYDHPHPATREDIRSAMRDYTRFWAGIAARTRGMIRLDNLHGSHEDFVRELMAGLQNEFPELLVVAECFSYEETLRRLVPSCRVNLLIANPWEYRFVPELRRYLGWMHDNHTQLRFLIPVTSHDTGSPSQLFGGPGSLIPRYALATLMGTGQAALVQGTEYGHPERIEFIRPAGEKMDLRSSGVDLSAHIRTLNRLHAEHAIFRGPGNLTLADRGHPAVIACLRREAGLVAVVAANFDTGNWQTIEPDLGSLGGEDLHWYDAANGEEITSGPGRPLSLSLSPCGFRALIAER